MSRSKINELKITELLTFSESLALLIKSKLWLQILIGMGSGISLGILISSRGFGIVEAHTSALIAGWVALPDTIFWLSYK